MIVTNHFLAGVAIAGAVTNPVLAIPLAFASHYVMDALPHHGAHKGRGFGALMAERTLLPLIAVSTLSMVAVFLGGFLYGDLGWLAFICGWAAVSPDFAWVFRYFTYERQDIVVADSIFTRFHVWVQWYERPWAIIIEALVLLGLSLWLF